MRGGAGGIGGIGRWGWWAEANGGAAGEWGSDEGWASEVQRALQRINGIKNVKGTIIVDKEGNILHSTFSEDNLTTSYAAHVVGLTTMASSSIREIDNQTELQMLRVRSETHEFVIVPETQFTLIVVQGLKDPVVEKEEEVSSDNESLES
ncbi:hypothetical protein GOP47_0021519 [Adiantum capillus-veneris]|uniref:Roadblock/LAMTOR2 domain-containing protein n=1 Tax=Adiantum capillus-veneris TaxID=13818 RepID=A0A9D4U7Y8_ADICA|nr:hypothetical protein GOP47_0021519 [Adiantum capillus-veneris]